jgi:hypothetical protein
MNNDTGQTNLMIKSVQTTPHRHATPPTGRSAQPHPTRVNQLALTIKHTVEFSNNRRTPSEPQSFPITSLPGAVPQTYQALSDFSKSSPASWPGEFFELFEGVLVSHFRHRQKNELRRSGEEGRLPWIAALAAPSTSEATSVTYPTTLPGARTLVRITSRGADLASPRQFQSAQGYY